MHLREGGGIKLGRLEVCMYSVSLSVLLWNYSSMLFAALFELCLE